MVPNLKRMMTLQCINDRNAIRFDLSWTLSLLKGDKAIEQCYANVRVGNKFGTKYNVRVRNAYAFTLDRPVVGLRCVSAGRALVTAVNVDLSICLVYRYRSR